MNLKRLLAQSKLGQNVRRAVHNQKKRTLNGAISFLNDWGGVNHNSKMAEDMYLFCKKYNYSYAEYMFYHFFDRNLKERLEFISSEERIYCCEKLNKAKNWDIFENKANTYKKYKSYFKRDVCVIKNFKNESDKDSFRKFVSKHSQFIAKTLDDAGGVGIQKFDLRKMVLSDELIERFYEKYPKGCLLEEVIIQSKDFAQFHPQSVNTLRITTVRFNDHVEIIHPAMRIGTGESYVDNAGSNGILCAIDAETGTIIATANERGETFEDHPDTGIKLIGFKIPFLDEAIELAKELALIVPSNRYTGWDLAHTEKGWVLVEANSYGGFVIWQIPLQKGFRSEWENIIKRLSISER